MVSAPVPAEALAELMRERRSISRFRPETVPQDVLLRALDVARWAPNHHLTEPWHFYLLGPETRAAVVELNAELVAAKQGSAAAQAKRERWSAIPGWMLLTCERSPGDALRFQEDYASCCAAAQNFALYLWTEGIGVKWTTGDVTRDPRFYDLTWVDPECETVVGLFWYGYPAESPDSQRRPLAGSMVELP